MPALTREQLAARRATRRQRERRRRTLVLVAALLPIAAAAVIAAVIASGGSGSAQTLAIADVPAGARVPDPVPDAGLAAVRTPEDVTLATADGIAIKLPIPRSAITAIAYHAVDTPTAVPLRPRGSIDYDIAPVRGRPGSETAALDVGAAAGTTVYSPVDGVVVSVADPYVVMGKPAGYEMLVAPSRAAGLLVRMTHLGGLRPADRPAVGDAVRAGRTVVGRVADFTGIAEQELAQFTNDAGNHVHIEVVRGGTGLAP